MENISQMLRSLMRGQQQQQTQQRLILQQQQHANQQNTLTTQIPRIKRSPSPRTVDK